MPSASPSPEIIVNLCSAYQRTAALRTGVEIDVFTAIGEGVATAGALAARCHAAERGMRILIPGSAFTVEFGGGYDLVLLTHFLQDLDPATCESLLAKVHAALVPGGRAVALGFVPNDDRVSPPAHAAFGLAMLATTPGGDAYTVTELDRMFRNAGFARTELHELAPTERVVIAHRSRSRSRKNT